MSMALTIREKVSLAQYTTLKVGGVADYMTEVGSEEEVWAHIRRHDVPYNQLYEEGYRSIGCAPCTRPVVAGEDARAGRWWWETAAASECGIHFTPEGKLVRIREEAA